MGDYFEISIHRIGYLVEVGFCCTTCDSELFLEIALGQMGQEYRTDAALHMHSSSMDSLPDGRVNLKDEYVCSQVLRRSVSVELKWPASVSVSSGRSDELFQFNPGPGAQGGTGNPGDLGRPAEAGEEIMVKDVMAECAMENVACAEGVHSFDLHHRHV